MLADLRMLDGLPVLDGLPEPDTMHRHAAPSPFERNSINDWSLAPAGD